MRYGNREQVQELGTEVKIPPIVDCVLSKPPKLHELNEALANLTRSRAEIS
jgi:hypothetical protein